MNQSSIEVPDEVQRRSAERAAHRGPPPSPPGHWLMRVGKFQRDPLREMMRAAAEVGDVVRFDFGPLRMVLCTRPDAIQHVLSDNARNYSKQTIGYSKVKLALGEGLLTSEGDFWRRQRRIVQPAFHRESLRSFAATMAESTAAMLEGWAPAAAAGDRIDVGAHMTRLTLDIVCKTMFSLDMTAQAARLGQLMTTAIEYVNARTMALTSIFDFPDRLPTPKARRFRAAIREGDELVASVIADRRAAGAPERRDLLAMLMGVRDADTGEGMTDKQLRDEVITIFAAGHETTANLLTWVCLLLSGNDAVAARLHEEVDRVLGGRPPDIATLPALGYTRMVLKEAMRLYPPAWVLARRAIGDDVLDGYHVAAGTVVLVSPFVTQRDPRLWPDPDRFDPERFSAERQEGMPKYAYFPFGGGPRQCLGNHFAMMEAEIALATLASRFSLGHVEQEVELDPMVTLRPKSRIEVVPCRR